MKYKVISMMSAALYIIADSITITRTLVYRNFVDRMCPPVSLAKNHIRAALRVVTMTLVTRDRMNTEPFHFSRVYMGVSIAGGGGMNGLRTSLKALCIVLAFANMYA